MLLGAAEYNIVTLRSKLATISIRQGQVEKNLIEVGTEIRQLSHEVHPAVLQEAGLQAALSSYCEEFSKLRGIPIAYQADESVEELSPGAALCIYRIA